jgi:hypothetical protein
MTARPVPPRVSPTECTRCPAVHRAVRVRLARVHRSRANGEDIEQRPERILNRRALESHEPCVNRLDAWPPKRRWRSSVPPESHEPARYPPCRTVGRPRR